MAERQDVTKLDDQQAVIGLKIPTPGDPLRGDIGFMERLAERLYALASLLRTLDRHVAAQEVEFAAMGLVTGADRQREYLRGAPQPPNPEET